MKEYSKIMKDICALVLKDTAVSSKEEENYSDRIRFFYGLILEELAENELDDEHILEVVSEIIAVERYALWFSLRYLNAFQNVDAERILLNFSLLSQNMARFSLQNDCQLIAGYLLREYNELIEDTTVIPEAVAKEKRYIISETLLDFNYAIGHNDIMSLRLKRYLNQC